MPYEYFAALSDEDARALVVYLRSLPPVRKVSRRTELPFWLRLMVRISPRPLDGSPNPPTAAQPVPYGQFLANVALCAFCHTPEEPIGELGKPAFAGGYEFYGPGFVGSGASAGRVVTPNLTPDPDTGLGEVPREAFIGRFKSFAQVDPEARADPSVRTAMPWRELSGMTEEDLGAIYDYLRTVKPVSHRVVTRPDP